MASHWATVMVDSSFAFGMLELSNIAGNPSPRPSPGGRGRSSSVTRTGIFFVEWTARWLRFARSHLSSVLRPSHVSQREKTMEHDTWPRRLQETLEHSTENPSAQSRCSQAAVHSAKEMHVQVTPLSRPLPPGEGRGEGLPEISGRSISRYRDLILRSHLFPHLR